MKSIDFTQPGGFPLTQDQLGYLQTAYSECLGALGSAAGDGIPVRLSGMVVTSTVFTSSITDGWIYYNGEIIRFVGGGLPPAILFGSEIFIVISTTSGALTFNDGSTPGVINESVAGAYVLPSSTPTDATHFPYGSLVSFGQALGTTFRESAWKHLAVSTGSGHGSISGDVYYKKDTIANTLQIRGLVATATPGDFAAWPLVTSISMGTFQVGYRPANVVPFTVQTLAGANMTPDANGTYFSRLNATLGTDGKLIIDWISPDTPFTIYYLQFNLVVPLD